MIVIGSEEVARELDRPGCITMMRDAMIALSAGHTRQLLRGIIDLVLWSWGPDLPHRVDVYDPSGEPPRNQLCGSGSGGGE